MAGLFSDNGFFDYLFHPSERKREVAAQESVTQARQASALSDADAAQVEDQARQAKAYAQAAAAQADQAAAQARADRALANAAASQARAAQNRIQATNAQYQLAFTRSAPFLLAGLGVVGFLVYRRIHHG